MKKWEKPELEVLGVELTMNGNVSGDVEHHPAAFESSGWMPSTYVSNVKS